MSPIRIAFAFLCVGSLLLPDIASAADRPNIIFIMADDLGYGELGCYGQTKIQTPHIDQLAADGMRFTQCYAGSNVCAPSRSTLMTGLHTGHTPIRANGSGRYLLLGDVTTGEVLKQAGYTTGAFGKWGLGIERTTGHPNRQGFDDFFGQLHQVHAHFYYPYYLWKNESKFFMAENEGRKRARYAHDEIHAQAVRFIEQNADKPFFAYLPYIIPHVELVVPEDSLRPYLGKWEETPLADPRPGYIGSDTPYATFAGMVSRMDGHIGQIVALIEKLGIAENTVIFFTSDNGGQGGAWTRMTDFFDGNAPLRGYKGEFYEGGIRVPMVVRWPGRIVQGSETNHVCAFWDVMPTLAAIAGADTPEKIDGISFLPTLLGSETQPQHEHLYWEYPRGENLVQALRMGDWKLVQPRPGQPMELYNLKDDVGETNNLVDANPDVVEEMQRRIAMSHTEAREPVAVEGPGIDDYVR